MTWGTSATARASCRKLDAVDRQVRYWQILFAKNRHDAGRSASCPPLAGGAMRAGITLYSLAGTIYVRIPRRYVCGIVENRRDGPGTAARRNTSRERKSHHRGWWSEIPFARIRDVDKRCAAAFCLHCDNLGKAHSALAYRASGEARFHRFKVEKTIIVWLKVLRIHNIDDIDLRALLLT
jgi:hypothetical protein